MKRIFLPYALVSFLLLGSVISFGQSTSLKYPMISMVHGKVSVKSRVGQEREAKKDEILRERAIVETNNTSQIRIELDEKNSVVVFENTKLEIPVIGSEKGEVVDLNLEYGKMRIESASSNQRFYSTPITRDIYTDTDFLLEYDRSLGRATATVFRGSIQFRGLENEIDTRVEAAQKAYFQGVMESSMPTYDILLKGRKISRGKLSEVETIDTAQLDFTKASSVMKREVKPKGPPPEKRLPGQICEKPFGKLDQCSWVCEGLKIKKGTKNPKCNLELPGVQCVRFRCNANGKWSDRFELVKTQSKCEAKPVIGPCDY